MRVGIIGLGLLGGSMALALKACGYAAEVVGWDLKVSHRQEAVKRGLVDAVLAEDRVLRADLVVVAIPIDQAASQIATYLERSPPGTVLMDVGSTKSALCRQLADHPARCRFVATHPIAGTEFSGPSAARGDLFSAKITLICEPQKSAPQALARVRALYACLRMKVLEMEAEAHDLHMAYISHLSHLSSFALASTVLALEKDRAQLFNLAGSGFASTVRLAKSAAHTWTPILLENRENLLIALRAYRVQLEAIQAMIEGGEVEALHRYLERSNRIAGVLKGL